MDKKIYLDKVLDFLVDNVDDIPDKLEDKVKLWEELVYKSCNTHVPEDVLTNEDKFLRLDLFNRRLTDGEKLSTIDLDFNSELKFANKISLWKGDITTIYADVLVNSTTKNMIGCSQNLDGTLEKSIFTRSGMRLRIKCREIMNGQELNNTELLVTRAYNLPADFIIHVVVPSVLEKITEENVIELKMCYLNVLECVKNNMARIVVLPCLGAGFNGFPKDISTKVALEAVNEFLEKNSDLIDKVIFNVYDDEMYNIYFDLLK